MPVTPWVRSLCAVTPCTHSITGRHAAEGVDVKLSNHIEQKKQESTEYQQSIVEARQEAEKLEEDVRQAQRDKELALSKKQQEVDDLRATVRLNRSLLVMSQERVLPLAFLA